MSEAGIIEAVVQVGAEETRYLRCGRGSRTVVVLAENAEERLRMIAGFSADHCVIAPMAEATPALTGNDPARLESWLRGMIDGLGLDRPLVVLSPGLAGLAESLASSNGDGLELTGVVTHEGS